MFQIVAYRPTVYRTESVALSKGQLILKANFQAVDSPKKQTNGVWLYYVTTLQVKKGNSSVHFFGESMAWKFAFEINWPLVVL